MIERDSRFCCTTGLSFPGSIPWRSRRHGRIVAAPARAPAPALWATLLPLQLPLAVSEPTVLPFQAAAIFLEVGAQRCLEPAPDPNVTRMLQPFF